MGGPQEQQQQLPKLPKHEWPDFVIGSPRACFAEMRASPVSAVTAAKLPIIGKSETLSGN